MTHFPSTDIRCVTYRGYGFGAGSAGRRRIRIYVLNGRPSQIMPSRTAKAAASVRVLTPSLSRMCVRWVVTVRGLMNRAAAISRSIIPLATSRSTSISRALSPPRASTGRLVRVQFRQQRLCPIQCRPSRQWLADGDDYFAEQHSRVGRGCLSRSATRRGQGVRVRDRTERRRHPRAPEPPSGDIQPHRHGHQSS